MTLDMRPMQRGETDRITIQESFLPRLPAGVDPVGEAQVTGDVTDQAGYMHLVLQVKVPYKTLCARCLDPVNGTFEVSLERTVADEKTLSEKQLEENVDEYAIIRDGMLDLDELVEEEVLLSFPMRVLCSPDCEGLCPKCGKPRRLGDCGCSQKEIDPRLAVLKTLLKEEKN